MLLLKHHIIVIYLGCIMLILTTPTLLSIMQIIIPLLIISLAIHLKKIFIGIIGISLFFIISLQTLTIPSMEDLTFVFLYILIILLPNLLLLNYILQLNHPHHIIVTNNQKKPLILTLSIAGIIFIVFYLIAFIAPNNTILASDTLEIQVLILAALSIITTIPLIIK